MEKVEKGEKGEKEEKGKGKREEGKGKGTKKKTAEIYVCGGNIILVSTGDVLSCVSVYPESFQLSPHV